MKTTAFQKLAYPAFLASLVLTTALQTLSFPVRAQNTDSKYVEQLRNVAQQVVDKNITISLSMYKLPPSVGDRYEFRDSLALAFAQKDIDSVVSILQPHGLTIATNKLIVFDVNVFPYQPVNANLNAANAIVNDDAVALQAAMSQPDFAIDNVVYIPNEYGVTLAMIATTRGNADIVRLLIEAGANPNGTGEDLSSPLSRAAYFSYFDIAKQLVQAGAKVNIRSPGVRTEETILANFANLERTELVELLLDHGANADTGDRFGWTPLMNAVHSQNLDLVQLLLPHSDPRIKSEQEITITDHDIKEIDAEYPIVTAMDIAARFDTPVGKQIAQAIQLRLDGMAPPAVSLAEQLSNALKELREYRTNFDISATLETAKNAIELLAETDLDETTHKDVINHAIYLLLYKHEVGLVAGEALSATDLSLAKKLTARGSKAQKWHDMLDVLGEAQLGSAQPAIDVWEAKYGLPGKGLWDFDLLARWIDSNEEISIRDRMYDTLDYFDLR